MDSILSNPRNVKAAVTGEPASSVTRTMQQSVMKSSIANKKECVQCILAFLGTKGFQPCSAKDLLRSPPLQTLLDIWNFLFRLLDPSANVTKDNMVVEVPKFFKEFAYPHIMKTSNLRTPTADHQWESNLIALSWLCKLLLYEQECFGKSFDNVAVKRQHLPMGINAQATISTSAVDHFVTEQARKHFNLYVRGEENSVELMADFQSAISDLILSTQDSVDKKMIELEVVRDKALSLQDELENYSRTKEWMKTAKAELQRIEELTASIRGSCLHAVEALKSHNHTLREEEAALSLQEEQNRELERIIEKQDINKNAVIELNQAIRKLKAHISDSNRRIKELQHEIVIGGTKTQLAEDQVMRAGSALESLHESMKNILANKGQYAEAWHSLEPLKINCKGTHTSDILGVPPSAYSNVVDEMINRDRDMLRMSRDTRTALELSNQELESLYNSIAKEISDTLRKVSSLFQTQLREEKDSALQAEATNVANSIRATKMEELERAKSELAGIQEAVAEAQNRLREQESQAQTKWQETVNKLKEAYTTARNTKQENREMLQDLIDTENRILQENKSRQQNTA
ncbi:HEC/Ndc80p family protein [Babesia bovis T2Bo]|uniref:HEC/Ndc80p family protein n=1 Tax=Babesia bovis T2Bo TaxID=484906 RepID=UPI001D68D748|nr:HEC/Ndc80p family protein [Babesia bovis T2Bo]EDO06894.2 HEC/Ndc80p family protein [Babesia bovis T2Bo]